MGVGTRIVSTGAAVPSLGHARASRPCQARHTANGKVNFAIALLAEVLTQGRAADHGVAAYVREPSKDVVDVRDLFDTRICLGVTTASHVDMALGEGARDRGALADEIPGDPAHAGIGFVIDPITRLPIRFRAGFVIDPDIDDLVTRCTPHTGPGDEDEDGEVLPFPVQTDDSDDDQDNTDPDDSGDEGRAS